MISSNSNTSKSSSKSNNSVSYEDGKDFFNELGITTIKSFGFPYVGHSEESCIEQGITRKFKDLQSKLIGDDKIRVRGIYCIRGDPDPNRSGDYKIDITTDIKGKTNDGLGSHIIMP